MDYERIHKPLAPQGGGGFSPGRLRAMLLGVETKRKEREDLEANFSLRSESSESDDRRKNLSLLSCYVKISPSFLATTTDLFP
ncbi:hypothetical protein GW17_00051688 [Ensete ventricosum]|nr:hypothetical protein GW17_00051688 [Ensete ventricosum]